ncbi:DUF5671 domain-containing protein [Porticoccaceae bacterium]|nr:DUF5671 domain-containing protein [Porticoccaceae bacterium]
MADSALSLFVKEALASGASRTTIEEHLLTAGWSKDQVTSALGEFSAVEFAIPIPKPKPQFRARDTFLYATMFIMLYLSSYNLANLLFQFVNLGFPDANITTYPSQISRSIRFNVSALLVAFPVFLFVAFKITKQIEQEPVQRTSPVRKWLTYLTLSVAACFLVGDTISLLNGFLSGNLTVRSLLKLLIVAGIAGGLFYYYLSLMRKDDEVTGE